MADTAVHARILAINTEKAKAAPGVVAVFTGADMAADGVFDDANLPPSPTASLIR